MLRLAQLEIVVDDIVGFPRLVLVVASALVRRDGRFMRGPNPDAILSVSAKSSRPAANKACSAGVRPLSIPRRS